MKISLLILETIDPTIIQITQVMQRYRLPLPAAMPHIYKN